MSITAKSSHFVDIDMDMSCDWRSAGAIALIILMKLERGQAVAYVASMKCRQEPIVSWGNSGKPAREVSDPNCEEYELVLEEIESRCLH